MFFAGWMEWFIPASLRRKRDTHRRARLAVLLPWVVCIWGPVLGVVHIARGSYVLSLGFTVCGLAGMAIPLLLRATGSMWACGNAVTLMIVGAMAVDTCLTGGIGSYSLIAA